MITLLHKAAGRFPFCTGIIRGEGGVLAMSVKAGREDDRMNQTGKTPQTHKSAAPARKRLIQRLWRTAERQVDEIDARLCALPDDPQALEREAKNLALVTRTVRDLVAIESESRAAPAKAKMEPMRDDSLHDSPLRSIEAFRAELAGRLDQLRRGGAGQGAS